MEETLEKVKLLLAAGANVNAEAANGNTPLHEACLMGNMRISEALLEAGADPFIKNVEGRFPHEMTFMVEFKELFDQFIGGRATKAAQ
jgi:ankyrin repeat protein